MKTQITYKNNFGSVLKQQQQQLKDIMPRAYDVFVKNTPVKSGAARRNTKYQSSNSAIMAQYAYAQQLDAGSSKQSPDGMSAPTLQFIETEFQKTFGE